MNIRSPLPLLLFVLAVRARAAYAGPAGAAPVEGTRERVLQAYANLPLTFVENRGQTDTRVRYHAQGPGYTFYLLRDEIVLSFVRPSGVPTPQGRIHTGSSVTREPAAQAATLALRFLGANAQTALEGADRAPGETHYFQGNDPARWHTQLPGYAQVVYHDLWPGVDLMLRGHAGALKYEFRVRPGARHEDIRLAYAGADGLGLDSAGSLLIKTPLGVLRDSPPVSYQMIAGARVPVESRYLVQEGGDATGEYGFVVGAGYQSAHELIIDPGLEYSTFLGGSGGDSGAAIAVDASGNAYIVGTTQSIDFPTTTGAFRRSPGNSINSPDVFVTKLNPAGSALIYSTYLAGGDADFGRAIAIDSAGNAYVTGETTSADFPTTPGAFDTTANFIPAPRFPGINDAFVTKLNASGSALVYSTYLGGTDIDEPRAIAIDAGGNAYVTGETVSADFPTTSGAFATTHGGEYDVFVTKLNATGSALVYSTFLGGLLTEIANAVVVDSANNALVLGSTRSVDFPTTPGAFDTIHNGAFDVFLTKLNAAGSGLVYSTLLGGANDDDGNGLAIDSAGNAFIAGGTLSPDFPTTPGAFDRTLDGGSDAFVAKLNASGSGLVYSTFLGGSAGEGATAIAVDGAGTAWVTGGTSSEDFPITLDAFDLSFNGISDAFLTRLNATGSALLYSTFFGGSNAESGLGLALDAAGDVYVTGETLSADFPTTVGAWDRIFNGDLSIFWGESFVAKFGAAIVSPVWQGPTLSALSLSPTSVVGGNASTGTVTLSAAAPIGGAVVSLSDDSAAVSVPSSVTVPAGVTSAAFAVTTSPVAADTTARISGTLGTARSAGLTLAAPPPLLSGLAVNPGSIVGGNSTVATVTLSAVQSGPTVIAIDPPPPTAPATLPASVTVPAGATSASFTIPTSPVTATFNLTIVARLEGAGAPGATALLLISPATSTSATLSALSLSATSVVGGGFLTGTVALSAAAPSGGAPVTLSDNSTAATTPSSVTVPAGATSATFTLTTTNVSADTSVILTATFNGASRTLTLTVTPAPLPAPTLSAMTLSPSGVVGGNSAAGTVTLSAAAPGGGASIALSSSKTTVASVPATVTIPAGITNASFAVTTAAVATNTSAIITASYNAVSKTASLAVTAVPAAASLQSVSVTPTSVTGGANSQGKVTLSTGAPQGGAVVALSSANPAVAGVPASVTVPAGATSATFIVTTTTVAANTSAIVTASYNAVSKTATLTVTAAPAAASLQSVSVSPTSVAGGTTSQGRVALSAGAPQGGAIVALSSVNPAVAGVPASVTVPAGATSATFTVTTTAVTTNTSAIITASYNAVNKTAMLTVTPPGQAATLTVTATGRSGERITSSPAGITVAVGSTGSAPFAGGTAITLSVSNGRDAIWSGACSSGGSKAKICTFTIAGSVSVTGNVQ